MKLMKLKHPMKYTITINQAGIADAGLAGKTDLIDWAILEYILAWQNHPKAARIGDKVWINYKHLISEMPLIGLNNKAAVSRRLSKLAELKLISIEHDADKRVFTCLTITAHEAINFRSDAADSARSGVTLHGGGVNHGKQGVNHGKQWGVNHGKHSADNHISADNHESSSADAEPSPPEYKNLIKPTRKRCVIPADWEITEGDKNHEFAEKNNMTWADLVHEESKFKNHHMAQGKPLADWDAAWRTWVLKRQEFNMARRG